MSIKIGVFGHQVATPRVSFGSVAQWNGPMSLFAMTVIENYWRSVYE